VNAAGANQVFHGSPGVSLWSRLKSVTPQDVARPGEHARPEDNFQFGNPPQAASLTNLPSRLPQLAAVQQEVPAAAVATPPQPSSETPSASPSLSELREKLYAVHATDFLPLSGEMVAGAKHVDPDKQDKEPPSFRPTIHFALGQMVAEHGRHSWDSKKFGVLLPLKDLEPQLANVSPHDTFIVGNLKLPPGAVVFVPEGTDTEGMPEHIQVQPYKGSLRKAIDERIQDSGGWSVKMDGVSNDDPAKVGDRDINSPEFFSELLKAKPGLSFGSHIGSEVGEAFRFGAIEQALVQFSRGFDPFGIALSNFDAKFYRAFIAHNAERLPQVTHPAAQRSLDEKKKNLESHLKVVDVDLKFRKKGFSLSRTSDQTRARAASLSFLGPLALPLLKSQLNVANDAKPRIPVMVEALSCLPPDELREFEKKNPELFQDVDKGALHARYAVSRWLHQRSDREGLESLLLDGMQKAKEPLELLGELSSVLKEDSYRKETALSILRRPAVQMNLQQEEGMQFSWGGPQTVTDVIKAHPQAREGLTAWDPAAEPNAAPEVELLSRLGRQYGVPAHQGKPSFEACRRKAQSKEFAQKRFQQDLADLNRPMNSLVPEDDRQPGLTLGLLELVDRDGINGQYLPKEAWQSAVPFKEYAAKLVPAAP
jgi:hypothetical protein